MCQRVDESPGGYGGWLLLSRTETGELKPPYGERCEGALNFFKTRTKATKTWCQDSRDLWKEKEGPEMKTRGGVRGRAEGGPNTFSDGFIDTVSVLIYGVEHFRVLFFNV